MLRTRSLLVPALRFYAAAGPPVIKPPFTKESALAKVKIAEDAWNSRDPERVSLAYTPDSDWRNRTDFFKGREKIKEFLTKKWQKELDYKLMKELWCYTGNRISVRFEYEYRDAKNPTQVCTLDKCN
jgi:nuclear transport factor 2 (NTF2) superfamily protein